MNIAANSDARPPGQRAKMSDLLTQGPLELEVKNFGPIAKANIDLRPLTVFVGPSNTGKSYLAILIYALHRFFSNHPIAGSPFRYRPSFFGYNPFLGDEDNQLPEDDLKNLVEWAKQIFLDKEAPSDEEITLIPDPIASLIRSAFARFDARGGANLANEISRCFGVNETKTLIRKKSRRGAQVILRRCISEDPEPFAHVLNINAQKTMLQTIPPSKMSLRIKDVHDELLKEFRRMAMEPGGDEKQDFVVQQLIAGLTYLSFTQTFNPLHLPAFYLPADRTGIMHAHRVVVSALIERATMAGLRQAIPTPMLSGVLADFLEQLIQLDRQPRWRLRGLRRGHKPPYNLGKQIEQIEKRILGGKVTAQKSETDYPFFTYQPEGWKDDLPLMNASSMVAELAPVVLYLRHKVNCGDVLIVEEPESHLHPKMQVAFTRQLAALVQAGVRVILTTHSEWVLEELANIVRLSELSKARRKGMESGDVALRPDQVGAWLFQLQDPSRGSVVKEIPLDDAGLYPSGFDDVAAALHNDWAEISSRIGESG